MAALGALGALALAGCNSLTSVDAPDVVQPADYTTPAGASALAIGAITRFTDAFGGTTANTFGMTQITASGLIGDELMVTSLLAAPSEWDRRNPADAVSVGHYPALHTARMNLLTAIRSLQSVAPDSSARIGQLFALTGYTEVFFGESFCSGVPLSRLDEEFRPLYGTPLTTQQMYEQALADFDSALVYGADSTRIVHLAAVGKGRAWLNLGRFGEAAQAVAGVPTTYVYNATFVTGSVINVMSEPAGFFRVFTIPQQEGGNGINWRTAADPRVPLVNRAPIVGADGVTPLWNFPPYLAPNGSVRLAGGVEARLIEAEAALQAGDPGTWLGIHNTLRATVPGLAALADPGTDAARADLHFRERAFWLFFTGHRQGDLRRLVRQYGRNAESVFPTGAWRDGQPYGTATNIAPAADASRNPNYGGCLDRNA